MSSRENFLRGSILRFLFFVWANSLGPIRHLANVARAKPKRRDGQGRNEKRRGNLAIHLSHTLLSFVNFNEPVSIGKQFKFARSDAQLAFYLTTNDK
jgi:hypothetical protein